MFLEPCVDRAMGHRLRCPDSNFWRPVKRPLLHTESKRLSHACVCILLVSSGQLICQGLESLLIFCVQRTLVSLLRLSLLCLWSCVFVAFWLTTRSPSALLSRFLLLGGFPTKIDEPGKNRVPLFQPLKSGGPRQGHLMVPGGRVKEALGLRAWPPEVFDSGVNGLKARKLRAEAMARSHYSAAVCVCVFVLVGVPFFELRREPERK